MADASELPEESELPDGDSAPHPAALARNWRTVLLVDASVGFAVFVVGLVVLVAWNIVVGGFIGSIGLVYVLLVARRGFQWAAVRRDAGL